jgi:hypothetical protein
MHCRTQKHSKSHALSQEPSISILDKYVPSPGVQLLGTLGRSYMRRVRRQVLSDLIEFDDPHGRNRNRLLLEILPE